MENVVLSNWEIVRLCFGLTAFCCGRNILIIKQPADREIVGLPYEYISFIITRTERIYNDFQF